MLSTVFVISSTFLSLPSAAPDPAALSKSFVDAVRQLNEEHLRRPGKTTEVDLGKRLPRPAAAALEKLLGLPDGPGVAEALVACGVAALDLSLEDPFDRIQKRLERSPEHRRRLGAAVFRKRFIVRGLGGLEKPYLEQFAEVIEAILSAYDETFGFKEWSKVPGKKVRFRVHLEAKIDRPPHFAPELPYHSEVDFPVVDASVFTSPTREGQFLFYGLCHELGHLIAMWGSPSLEEDHHAWAHYVGLVALDATVARSADKPWLRQLRDQAWRSLAKEREALKDKAPSRDGREGVLALFLALHDLVGPQGIGAAVNQLDAQNRRRRVNQVRYYTLAELRAGLLGTVKDTEKQARVKQLLP